MIVYISGAVRSDPAYMQKFEAAEVDVRDAHHRPINPAKFINGIRGATEEMAMDICYQLLDMAEAIYLLPDWTTSYGANQEVGYARAKGLKFFTPETLIYGTDIETG